MIYLDNAATSLKKPDAVIDAVASAMRSFGNSARGVHEEALAASRIIFNTRAMLAEMFNCPRADHVIFTNNSTESLNIAINGLFGAGDHVISTDLEHNSVLRPLYRLEAEAGLELDFVKADTKGNVNYDEFARLLRPNTKAVVCTHASNLTGNMLDLYKIGEFTKAHNLLLVVDASQTAGALPIDMQAMNIDVLCFTGHKSLLGPQGTGGMCIRPGVEIRPFKVGGTGVKTHQRFQPQEYPVRLEAGTLNGHGIAGMHAALEFLAETGIDNIHAHEDKLMREFLAGVSAIEGVTVYGDHTGDHAPIVTLNIRDYDSSEVADVLAQDYDIATRAGAHCAPRMHAAQGTDEQGAVRFSFGWFNTEADVQAAINAVKEIAAL